MALRAMRWKPLFSFFILGEVSDTTVASLLRQCITATLVIIIQNSCSPDSQMLAELSCSLKKQSITFSSTQWLMSSLMRRMYWQNLPRCQFAGWGQCSIRWLRQGRDLHFLVRNDKIWFMRLGTMFLYQFFHQMPKSKPWGLDFSTNGFFVQLSAWCVGISEPASLSITLIFSNFYFLSRFVQFFETLSVSSIVQLQFLPWTISMG